MKTRLIGASLALVTIVFFAVGCSSSKTTSKVKDFNLDEGPMGTVSFEASNSRYKALGTFKDWRFSEFSMTDGDLESINATIEIQMNSIEEKSPKLTDHLKAWDFFDVAKHPTATIRIQDVDNIGGNSYMARGFVTIKGMEKQTEVEFDVTNTNPMRIQGSLSVEREFFKIGEENTGIIADVPVNFDTALPTKK